MQVEVSCTARVPSSSGRPGQGEAYYSSQPGKPLHWVVGSSKVRSTTAHLTSHITGVRACHRPSSGAAGLAPRYHGEALHALPGACSLSVEKHIAKPCNDACSVQVPPGFEEGVCSMAKGERAYVSCPASTARSKDTAALLPDPPDGVDRVEYEVELLSMIQV